MFLQKKMAPDSYKLFNYRLINYLINNIINYINTLLYIIFKYNVIFIKKQKNLYLRYIYIYFFYEIK